MENQTNRQIRLNNEDAANQVDYKVALDIGTTKVIVVAGTRNQYGKIKVLGYSKLFNTGVQQGEIFNLLSVKDTVEHVISDMKKRFDIDVKKVSVGLSGEHIRVTNVSDYINRPNPEHIITETDIKKLYEKVKKSIFLNHNEQILDIFPQNFSVDFNRVQRPVGMEGRRLEGSFLAVIADTRKIDKIYKSLQMAGLEVEEIYMQSVASAEAVLNQKQKQAGVVLVDIGGGTTDLLIANKGIVRHTDVIPYGGDYITNEIQTTLSLLPEMAEWLKIKHGSTYPEHIPEDLTYQIDLGWNNAKRPVKARYLSEIIRRRMEHIAILIAQEIHNYQQHFPNEKLMAGVVLTGGGSLIKHIKPFMQKKLDMDVELGTPATHLSSNDFTEQLSMPMYATVIGLLKMSLDNENGKPAGSYEEAKKIEMKNEAKPIEQPELFPPEDARIREQSETNQNPDENITGFWSKIKNYIVDSK